MLGAVLDSGDPNVGIADDMAAGFVPQRLRFVEPRVALLLNDFRTGSDGVFEELDHVSFRSVGVARRVVFIFAEVGADL